MPILQDASPLDIKRLLELFPLSNLRQEWQDLRGTKEELCTAIAEKRDNLDAITRFMDENLSCCRQHIYIFAHNGRLNAPPGAIPEGEGVRDLVGMSGLYVIRARFDVVLRNPLEQDSIEFLWPVKVEVTTEHCIVRFVVLEKNLGSYFDRPFYLDTRSAEEDTIVRQLVGAYQLETTDLHKGIKDLWENGFMDSVRVDYKKPLSKASETMDEEMRIKANDPELYEALQVTPLLNTIFAINQNQDCTVSVFSAKPAQGYLAFLRYTEKKGDTDYVVREILRRNQ